MVNGRELRAPPPLNEQKEGQCMKFIMDVGPFQRLSRPSVIFHLPSFFSPLSLRYRCTHIQRLYNTKIVSITPRVTEE